MTPPLMLPNNRERWAGMMAEPIHYHFIKFFADGRTVEHFEHEAFRVTAKQVLAEFAALVFAHQQMNDSYLYNNYYRLFSSNAETDATTKISTILEKKDAAPSPLEHIRLLQKQAVPQPTKAWVKAPHDRSPATREVCSFCKIPGHTADICRKKQRQNQQPSGAPQQFQRPQA